MSTQVQTVSRLALRYIEDYGWKRGSMGNKVDGFCLFGALFEAAQDMTPRMTPVIDAPLDAAIEEIRRCLPDHYRDGSITRFNDVVAKDVEDIKRVLRCAAGIVS